jgi:hypothetical protein
MRARQVIESIWRERKPPHMNVDADTELDMAEKSAFTAHELALRRNRHHPRLWAKIKGSPFENEYRRHFRIQDE